MKISFINIYCLLSIIFIRCSEINTPLHALSLNQSGFCLTFDDAYIDDWNKDSYKIYSYMEFGFGYREWLKVEIIDIAYNSKSFDK